jgi:hypothetical protein
MTAKLKTSTAMTPVGNAPAYLASIKRENLGRGIAEPSPANYVTPQFIVPQQMSPIVDRHDAAYVEGVEPGSLGIRELGLFAKGEEASPFFIAGRSIRSANSCRRAKGSSPGISNALTTLRRGRLRTGRGNRSWSAAAVATSWCRLRKSI